MGLKYGDSVTLIKKSREGDKDVLRRVNAIVLHSASQPPNVSRSNALKGPGSVLIPEGEYLDLAYPRDLPEGQIVKSRDMSTIFQPTYATPPWQEGASIGWQAGSATAVPPVEAPPQPEPSAEDLDAVEEEQRAKEATSGKVLRIKGQKA